METEKSDFTEKTEITTVSPQRAAQGWCEGPIARRSPPINEYTAPAV